MIQAHSPIKNPAYQDIASSSNFVVEQLLGLVHTETLILHAKEALKSIPEGVEEEDEAYYEGEGGPVDSMGSNRETQDDEERWLEVSSSFSLEDSAKDLIKKHKEAMQEVEHEVWFKERMLNFTRIPSR